jgi:hypothetical protein
MQDIRIHFSAIIQKQSKIKKMEAFDKSDLANVTLSLQSIMDELTVVDDDDMHDTHQNMTEKTDTPPEDNDSADSKLKGVFGRAMKIFENEAAYKGTGAEGIRSKEREPSS